MSFSICSWATPRAVSPQLCSASACRRAVAHTRPQAGGGPNSKHATGGACSKPRRSMGRRIHLASIGEVAVGRCT